MLAGLVRCGLCGHAMGVSYKDTRYQYACHAASNHYAQPSCQFLQGAAIDIEALSAWARERLADFKVPSTIIVRDELPRTATERIAKHLLK